MMMMCVWEDEIFPALHHDIVAVVVGMLGCLLLWKFEVLLRRTMRRYGAVHLIRLLLLLLLLHLPQHRYRLPCFFFLAKLSFRLHQKALENEPDRKKGTDKTKRQILYVTLPLKITKEEKEKETLNPYFQPTSGIGLLSDGAGG